MGLCETINALVTDEMTRTDSSLSVVAARLKVAQPTLHRICAGVSRKPTIDTLAKIAAHYGVTVEDLYRPASALLPSTNSKAGDHRGELNVSPAPAMRGRVPLISSVQAGMWTEIIDNFHPGDAEAWLECHRDLGPRGYALRVNGDSMTAPTGVSFPHGMILYVNPHSEALPGKFVIVRRNGHEATFKRLTMVDGDMYLEAINPNWPNRYIKLTHDDNICGVVVHAGFELP